MTGKLRFTRYLFYCNISERIEDSPISTVLPAEMIASSTPVWHRVNTFSPGIHHSPHYIFHSAIHQIHMIENLWSLLNPPPEVKQKMALHLLALWQHSETDFIADNYIRWFLKQLPMIEKSEEECKALFDHLLSLNITMKQETDGVTKFTAFYPDDTIMDQYHAYLNDSGERVKHGEWTTWHSSTDGEQAVFKDSKLVEKWKPVTRLHSKSPAPDTIPRTGE
jgi:hypothetical protein